MRYGTGSSLKKKGVTVNLAFAVLLMTMGAGTKPLPALEEGLGRFDKIVEHEGGRKTGNDAVARYEVPSCKVPMVLNLTTVVAGLGIAVQQLETWTAKTPGLEAKLFGQKGVLVKTYQALMASAPVGSETCAAPEPNAKLRAQTGVKPEKPCGESEVGAKTLGNYWFGTGNQALAFVNVQQAQGCAVVLDAKVLVSGVKDGALRVQVSPEQTGATLTDRDCQAVEFKQETGGRRFSAVQRSCKK